MKTVFRSVIVGRPNVGKTSLFNKLTGAHSITSRISGSTVDYTESYLKGNDNIMVSDTAGLSDANIEFACMMNLTRKVIQKSDLIIFVIDGSVGIKHTDIEAAAIIRKSLGHRHCLLISNKCDKNKINMDDGEAFSLGLGLPLYTSAESDIGIAEIMRKITEISHELRLDQSPKNTDDDRDIIRIVISGRPNSGKSTLINTLAGEERMLISEKAGTTRDFATIEIKSTNCKMIIADTAGLRRKEKTSDNPLEIISAEIARKVIKKSHVVLLILDGASGPDRQDLRLANFAEIEGRAIVIALNKMDLFSTKDLNNAIKFTSNIFNKNTGSSSSVSIIPISGKHGLGIKELIDKCEKAYYRFKKRIPTKTLNNWFRKLLEDNPPPLSTGGKIINMKFIAQIRVGPPSFVISVNFPNQIPENYIRRISNKIREDFDFVGCPIRLKFRR